MGRRKLEWWESAIGNSRSFLEYYDYLTEMTVSTISWGEDLPEGFDERFLELSLFTRGNAVGFYDEVLKWYLTLECIPQSNLDLYGNPLVRTGKGRNGAQFPNLTSENSVMFYNNYLRTPTAFVALQYAQKLYELDQTIAVNTAAQKTPVLIICDDEKQRLSLQNLYAQYKGNAPVIYGTNALGSQPIKSISTGAPFIADRLYQLKREYINEYLTQVGIPVANTDKRERLINMEVSASNGGTDASKFSRLGARQKSAKEFNKMFGTNLDPQYRADLQDYIGSMVDRGMDIKSETEVSE